MDVDAGRILEGRATHRRGGRRAAGRDRATAAGPPDGQRGARPPRVRAHLQVERAGRARACLPDGVDDRPGAVRRGYDRAGAAADGRPHRARGLPSRAPGGVQRRRAAHRVAGAARSGASRCVRRPCATRLAPDDFVYHVVERGGAGKRRRAPDDVRPVGSLLGVDVAADDREAALARLTDPAVTVVTVTVTEHGYCAVGPVARSTPAAPEIAHDLERPAAPRSLPGLLLEASSGAAPPGIAPFTVASCDNLPSNGAATARVVGELAECRDPALAGWVADNVAFPSSMVDRMVPATTDARPGPAAPRWASTTLADRHRAVLAVGARGRLPGGRPHWERVGRRAGRATSRVTSRPSCASSTPRTRRSPTGACSPATGSSGRRSPTRCCGAAAASCSVARCFPTLEAPPGWDLARYAEQVLDRFANPALPYTTAKVAGDGSQKLARAAGADDPGAPRGRPAAAPGARRCWRRGSTCIAGPRRRHCVIDDAAPAPGSGPARPGRAAAGVRAGRPPSAARPARVPRRRPTRPHQRVRAPRSPEHAAALWHGDVAQRAGARPAASVARRRCPGEDRDRL